MSRLIRNKLVSSEMTEQGELIKEDHSSEEGDDELIQIETSDPNQINENSFEQASPIATQVPFSPPIFF
jgi:hypothetical protein